jgi:hypothetical protein
VTLTTSKRPPTRPENRIRVVSGRHGHRIGVDVILSFAAELIGTFVLVLAIISSAIAATLAEPVAGASFNSLAVPIAGVRTRGRCGGFWPHLWRPCKSRCDDWSRVESTISWETGCRLSECPICRIRLGSTHSVVAVWEQGAISGRSRCNSSGGRSRHGTCLRRRRHRYVHSGSCRARRGY